MVFIIASMQTFNLVALPAFSDNYIWMLHDGVQAVVVDPGDAAPVIDALDEWKLKLVGILVTHHHPDHVGGVDGLRPRLQGPVHAPARETIPAPNVPHLEGDVVDLMGLRFDVIDVPGHTLGHIAYVTTPPSQAPILFCGDTLFSGGCGRLFEGTPSQMHGSLSKLAALPGETRVCCAHEYTLSNLRFATAVEPANQALQAYVQWCEAERRAGRYTLPSTVARERSINPFLRSDVPDVIQSAKARGVTTDDPVEVFAALREWKNVYR